MKPGPEEFTTALRALMMPSDTNHQGTVFGGVVLSRIDQAGYLEARRHGRHRWVTASMETVNFHAPVFTGDVVSFLTRTIRTGTSSVTVEVRVEAERHLGGETALVTEAHLTMVAVDRDGRAIDFSTDPEAAS
ncbi:MAG: acyl-CoA thioesterase [Planctomycetota bacterium]|nr:acyl-CoA thioesterase [Planctomycetota bacterium]MEE2896797.1 acyl-CoA thioesterase [Planctomycetota bacterium]